MQVWHDAIDYYDLLHCRKGSVRISEAFGSTPPIAIKVQLANAGPIFAPMPGLSASVIELI